MHYKSVINFVMSIFTFSVWSEVEPCIGPLYCLPPPNCCPHPQFQKIHLKAFLQGTTHFALTSLTHFKVITDLSLCSTSLLLFSLLCFCLLLSWLLQIQGTFSQIGFISLTSPSSHHSSLIPDYSVSCHPSSYTHAFHHYFWNMKLGL